MERVARGASLPSSVALEVVAHTRAQFRATTRQAWAHVIDPERLLAIDGRPLDERTPDDHAATLDVEDCAVLFEIDRLRAAREGTAGKAPRAFDLVAVDETQELAPLELALIGRSLAPGGTLIVAGDADQQTDESIAFESWDGAMLALGATDHDTTTLEIGRRCPPDVVELARGVRDATPSAAAPIHVFADQAALAATLGPALAVLRRQDRRATMGIVVRSLATARRLTGLLRPHVPARLVLDGSFSSRTSVPVGIVDDVKGLELDYVVIADADSTSWPDDPRSRRALYVAITRARTQVVLAATGPVTPLISSVRRA